MSTIAPQKRSRGPGHPIFSAELAKQSLSNAERDTPRWFILRDRVRNKDRSRLAQAKRLGVSQMTLGEAEDQNRWPIGSAGTLMRLALKVIQKAGAK